jgi:hypothetical protein
LFTYELHNKKIRRENEAYEVNQKGEKTFDQAVVEEIE